MEMLGTLGSVCNRKCVEESFELPVCSYLSEIGQANKEFAPLFTEQSLENIITTIQVCCKARFHRDCLIFFSNI